MFRGLLSVHSRYGLPARGVPKGPFPSEASAASLPPLPLRLLPAGATVAGWELHPLEDRRLFTAHKADSVTPAPRAAPGGRELYQNDARRIVVLYSSWGH